MEKDGLTGLLLRGQYEEDLKTFKQNDLCIVYFDVNNLKKTNDSMGHRFGDKLLLATAKAMTSCFRTDNIYRTGGDEFIILANGLGPQIIEDRLTKIRELLDLYTKNDPDGLVYQVAMGYAIGDGIMTKQEIEEKAESLMYQNKKALKGMTETPKKVISDEAYENARKQLAKPIAPKPPIEDIKISSFERPKAEPRKIPLVEKYKTELYLEPFITSAVIILTSIFVMVYLAL